jgi:uncharacterized protein YeaO (DUF488 family)
MPVRVKRAYDPIGPIDGQRVLVDRLWPRGLKKESLGLHQWLKDAGPSDALRRWFGHKTPRWPEFRRRYFIELDAKPDVTQQLMKLMLTGPVTLVYSARDRDHNQAVALKDYLEERLRNGEISASRPTTTSAPNNQANSSPISGEHDIAPRRDPEPSEEDWDRVLQASWESFPASDAPGWR